MTESNVRKLAIWLKKGIGFGCQRGEPAVDIKIAGLDTLSKEMIFMCKTLRLIFLLTGFTSIFLTQVCADDTYFGGFGADVFPSTKTKVRMISEVVAMKRIDRDVFATCDFTFINPGKDAVVTMGFPAEPQEDESEEPVKADLRNVLIKDFTALADGKKLPVGIKKCKNQENIKGLDFDYAFVWKVNLPHDQTVHLHHTYQYGISGNSGGQWWMSYILKSGALWDGKIDSAEISIDLNEDVSPGLLKIEPKNYLYKKGVIKWVFKDFKPTEDIRVEIDKSYIGRGSYTNMYYDHTLEGKTLVELRLMRNEIYARHGKIFNSKDLREYFSKQSWYEPYPYYTPDMLSANEKHAMEMIQNMEKLKKKQNQEIDSPKATTE